MYLDDKPHEEWEMAPKTQRKFSIGVVVVVAFVVLMNLIGGAGPSVWNQERPYVVASE